MSDRRVARRSHRDRILGTVLVATVAAGLLIGTLATAAEPVLPDADWSPLLTALVGPALSEGGSGQITFEVTNPLPNALSTPTLAFDIYAFNPTDGGPAQSPPAGVSVSFAGGSLQTMVSLGSPIAPGLNRTGGVAVSVHSGAPTGDYAVRISLTFSVGNVSYLLESRGFFSAAAWAAATQLSNGTPTINASRLGVSGVIPETSVLVSPASTSVILYVVLGVGLALAGVGAYWWTRSDAKSRTGARRSSPPQSAPTAFGSNLKSEGD